jgi:hypothetical protein
LPILRRFVPLRESVFKLSGEMTMQTLLFPPRLRPSTAPKPSNPLLACPNNVSLCSFLRICSFFYLLFPPRGSRALQFCRRFPAPSAAWLLSPFYFLSPFNLLTSTASLNGSRILRTLSWAVRSMCPIARAVSPLRRKNIPSIALRSPARRPRWAICREEVAHKLQIHSAKKCLRLEQKPSRARRRSSIESKEEVAKILKTMDAQSKYMTRSTYCTLHQTCHWSIYRLILHPR